MLLLSQDCMYKAVSVVMKAYAESCGCRIITKSIIMLLRLYTSNYLLKGIDKRINSACQEQPENVLENKHCKMPCDKNLMIKVVFPTSCLPAFFLLSSLPVCLPAISLCTL